MLNNGQSFYTLWTTLNGGQYIIAWNGKWNCCVQQRHQGNQKFINNCKAREM